MRQYYLRVIMALIVVIAVVTVSMWLLVLARSACIRRRGAPRGAGESEEGDAIRERRPQATMTPEHDQESPDLRQPGDATARRVGGRWVSSFLSIK